MKPTRRECNSMVVRKEVVNSPTINGQLPFRIVGPGGPYYSPGHGIISLYGRGIPSGCIIRRGILSYYGWEQRCGWPEEKGRTILSIVVLPLPSYRTEQCNRR